MCRFSRCNFLSRAFHAEWWSRVDKYCQDACQQETVDELVSFVTSADPVVVNWYSCMARGLRARVAGGARLRQWRPSPGCGVHRRRRGLQGLPHQKRCDPQCEVVESEACKRRERSVRSLVEAGLLRIVDCGAALRGWRGKCLQKSVVSCCRGDRQRRAERLFAACAANHVGSGLSGTYSQRLTPQHWAGLGYRDRYRYH